MDCFELQIFLFQRIRAVSPTNAFNVPKDGNEVQLVQKRLFEESFSENLLKLQVISFFKASII